MKDNTLITNNTNKTKIIFQYNHDLPFKHSIEPKIEYGDWKGHENKTLIKVYLDEEEMNLFVNKEKILGSNIYTINDKYWIDLEDVYLIIKKDNYLEKKLQEKNIVIAFLFNDKLISGITI